MSDVADVVASLQQKGVSFRVENERLLYFAPKGVVTSAELADLRSRKAEIVSSLLSLQQVQATQSPCVQYMCTFSPLTFQQEMLWEMVQKHKNWNQFLYGFALLVSGSLDLQELREQLQLIVRRHGTLRTRIVTLGSTPMQRVGDVAEEWDFEVVSFVDLPESDRVCEARRFIENYIDGVTDPDASNLFEVKVLCMSDRARILMIAIHHIISDAYSLGLFFRELWLLFNGSGQRREELQKSLPAEYAKYAAWQRSTDSTWRAEHEAYWAHRLANSPYVRIRDRSQVCNVEYGRTPLVQFTIGESTAAEIRKWAKRRRTFSSLIMLSIFVIAVSRWSSESDLLILFDIAGRHLPEHTGMIGFFAYYQFLRVVLDSNDGFREVLAKIAREFSMSLDHQDYSRGVTHAPSGLIKNPSFNWIQASPEMAGLSSLPLKDRTGGEINVETFPFRRKMKGAEIIDADSAGGEADSGPGAIVYDTGSHFNVTLLYQGYSQAAMEKFGSELCALTETFVRSVASSLSDFLCLRHIMTPRSQYAEKTQAACQGGHYP